MENTSGVIKTGENDQPEELQNALNGFGLDDNECENFDDEKHCETPNGVSINIIERPWQNKSSFTFRRIKIVSRTNGRNIKQPKAQKNSKNVSKGSNEVADGWNQLKKI